MSDDAALRAARRRVARELHPDLGGDPEAYVAAMAALDRTASPGPSGTADGDRPVVVGRPRRLPTRRVRAALRDVQQRLPRRVPGARRWARL